MDAYTRWARLYPALLTLLPLGVLLAAVLPAPRWWATLAGLSTSCGTSVLLVQFGRGAGRRKEQQLFDTWGGKPTTVLLRHRTTDNPIVLGRRHDRLAALVGTPFPTADEEAADPAGADLIYDAAVAVLRERTRDHEQFPIVFEELRNYGFRRNLWALRPLGLTIATVTTVTAAGLLAADLRWDVRLDVTAITTAITVGLVTVATWIWLITSDWVRHQAHSYAEALLAAAELQPSAARSSPD
jgi:hypothetical protein